MPTVRREVVDMFKACSDARGVVKARELFCSPGYQGEYIKENLGTKTSELFLIAKRTPGAFGFTAGESIMNLNYIQDPIRGDSYFLLTYAIGDGY